MSLIRGTALSLYPELVTELGGDPDLLLRRAGVDPDDVGRRDAFIAYRGLIDALESAAVATDTVDFGRRLGLRQGIEILGPVGVAAMHAPTVGDAFEIFETYMAAYSTAISAEFTPVPASRRTRFSFRILLPVQTPVAQTLELSVAVALRVLQALIAPTWTPSTLHLPHDPLGHRRDYVEAFGGRPLFAERFAGFTFPQRHLDRRLAGDAVTHGALLDYLQSVVGDASSGFTPRVRELVRELLPTGSVTLDLVAEQFTMHGKTLQRRLADEDTTFSRIVEDVRRELATHYLRDTDLPMFHISHELGYAEQSVLTRSSRRWFGHGPAEERLRLRGDR